jgi:outer membrane lipoprotein SlyB
VISALKPRLESDVKFLLSTVLMLTAVSACTTTNEIIIDDRGVNMAKYEDDLAQCEVFSDQVAVGEKTARGAASGAAVGGAIGAVNEGGHHGNGAGEGAAIGAISGGAKGMNEGQKQQVQVVKRCLRGRGYRVLN